ncbi:MAG: hypothetical protein KA505_11180 [Xanthomonadales bacterium]|jgi:hypothetical protein|nr:hypothetical protein [Xanthomonadales bacterium]MBP7622776.1 hypothetical protein [Xanthomonadales bacterium]
MTGNQFRFVVLTVFAVANIAAAWWWVPPSSGRGDALLVTLLCAPTVTLAWWWSERLERPKGESRALGDFFAMPKVQRWSALGLLVVVGFAAWRLWTAPDAPRDLLLITVPLPFLPPILTWWIDHWRAIGRRDATELVEALRIARERATRRAGA